MKPYLPPAWNPYDGSSSWLPTEALMSVGLTARKWPISEVEAREIFLTGTCCGILSRRRQTSPCQDCERRRQSCRRAAAPSVIRRREGGGQLQRETQMSEMTSVELRRHACESANNVLETFARNGAIRQPHPDRNLETQSASVCMDSFLFFLDTLLARLSQNCAKD